MKKIVLLLFSITQLNAVQSLSVASKLFQQRLQAYLKNKTPETAQDVVDVYFSTHNTDKYRRIFDSTLSVKKLTIDIIKQEAQVKTEHKVTEDIRLIINNLKRDLGAFQSTIEAYTDTLPSTTSPQELASIKAEIRAILKKLDSYNSLWNSDFQGKEFLQQNMALLKKDARALLARIP